jgi:iron complex outermembrane receptor protein
VLLAGRYNTDRSSFDTRSAATLQELAALAFERSGYEFDISRTVGQAGVTYELSPATNVYVNWGQTYEPSFGRQYDAADPAGPGIPLAPEEGDQVEIGLKSSILGGRMSVTFAAFDMERGGISQGDRDHPGFDIPLGTQRSRGVELGASGELSPGWQLFASAAILDAEFVEGEFEGEHAANAPRRALSVFTSYQFRGGPAKGFGAGLGYVHKSGLENLGQVLGHAPIRFDFGDINELDLRLFYQAERWEASLTARNVLDDLYYAPTVFNELRFGISVNPGRTVVAGLTYRLY